MTSPETLELEAVDAALAGRYVAPEHAELAELALLLRDDRPEPSPAWATHLDRRVEAGFPARPKQRKTWIWLRNAAPALAPRASCVLAVVGGGDADARRRRRRRAAAASAGSGGAERGALADSGGSTGSEDGGERRAGPPETSRCRAAQSGGDPGSDRRANARCSSARPR